MTCTEEKDLQAKYAKQHGRCANCGGRLSTDSILAACEEAGVSRPYFLTLYCPSYDHFTDLCAGMTHDEHLAPAQWALDYKQVNNEPRRRTS